MGTDHACLVTLMLQGGYRAECSCGWWEDLATEDAARTKCRHHGGTLPNRVAAPLLPEHAPRDQRRESVRRCRGCGAWMVVGGKCGTGC